MFDDLLDPATCGEISRAQMVTAIRQYHCLQATATARTWAFIAMLLRDHEDDAAAAEQQHWAHDAWAAARDQIGPALSLSPRRASGQMRLAEALAVRLPEVAALLEHAMISESVAATIVYRTELVDPSAHAVVDAEIAARAGGFTTLSETDLEMAIDAVVEEHDPDAVRRYREAAKNCDVQVGKRDATGTASLYGRVCALDADLSVRILNAYTDTVCADDPRSKGELRAAAYGAVFRRQDRLVCQCGTPACVAATTPSPVESVIVHVLTEQATLEAALAQLQALQKAHPTDSTAPTVDIDALIRDLDHQPHTATDDTPPWEPPTHTTEADAGGNGNGDAQWAQWTTPATDDGDDEDEPPWGTRATPEPTPGPDDPDSSGASEPDAEDPEQSAPQPDPTEPTDTHEDAADPPAATAVPPAVTLAGAIIPTALLAELIRTGATITALPIPTETPRTGYAFTGTLRDFIQCRDMRCRFPGCNRRADYADIDHTLPHGDGGPTHASNGKVLCREHHLVKTFRTGPDGWTDEQLPTGEVIWRAPTGHEYLTAPSTRLIFPNWNPETAKLPPPKRLKRRKTNPARTMPTRTRTRKQDRQQHINAERQYNATQRALEEDGRQSRPPPKAWAD